MKPKSYISSRTTLILLYLLILAAHLSYPKWNQERTESTLSWDVSGYYMYLPAAFIYKDLKQCSFQKKILNKYSPTPDFQQAFKHSNGNFVMKYSVGQAIQFSPFFFIAHFWASNDANYPADGFFLPYQLLISLGSLMVAFLGLFYLRKLLLFYFEDKIVSTALVILVFATNYLNYTAIDGAQTHNNLFTIYCILIYTTILFYKNPTLLKSIAIGLLLGIGALTRPTEIIAAVIPLFWGVNLFSKKEWNDRITFLSSIKGLIITSILTCFLIGSLQFIYWKYVADKWLVYSYQNQGFSWLSPHVFEGIFSYKSGWLVYSPALVFSLLGFFFLSKKLKGVTLLFFSIFIYIAFSWDIWWYGGSLGQRTMVQCYPILMFPLCALIRKIRSKGRTVNSLFILVLTLFSYLNFWFTYQVHSGGLLYVNEITKEYFWETLGKLNPDPDAVKLLDTDEFYTGKPKNLRVVDTPTLHGNGSYDNSLEGDSQGFSLCLKKTVNIVQNSKSILTTLLTG